jgi:hypothetical protein
VSLPQQALPPLSAEVLTLLGPGQGPGFQRWLHGAGVEWRSAAAHWLDVAADSPADPVEALALMWAEHGDAMATRMGISTAGTLPPFAVQYLRRVSSLLGGRHPYGGSSSSSSGSSSGSSSSELGSPRAQAPDSGAQGGEESGRRTRRERRQVDHTNPYAGYSVSRPPLGVRQ